MKTALLSILFSVALFGAEPPTVATNVVKLTAKTRAEWGPPLGETNIHGYLVRASEGTNQWERYTTNTFLPILALSTNLPDGEYRFAVSAVSRSGVIGEPAMVSTNLTRVPSQVVNLQIKLVFE